MISNSFTKSYTKVLQHEIRPLLREVKKSHKRKISSYLRDIKLIGATFDAEVRVALPNRQEARALLGVALCLATAPRETFPAITAALAKLRTQERLSKLSIQSFNVTGHQALFCADIDR